jgi:hypothetical protein
MDVVEDHSMEVLYSHQYWKIDDDTPKQPAEQSVNSHLSQASSSKTVYFEQKIVPNTAAIVVPQVTPKGTM